MEDILYFKCHITRACYMTLNLISCLHIYVCIIGYQTNDTSDDQSSVEIFGFDVEFIFE